MDIAIKVDKPLAHTCPALVVGCPEDGHDTPFFAELDAALDSVLSSLYRQGEFIGRLNSAKLLHTFGRIPAERVLLVGLGNRKELTPDRLRQAAGTAMQQLLPTGVKNFSTIVHQVDEQGDGALQAVVEGTVLGGYTFEKYKTSTEDRPVVEEVTLLARDDAARASATRVAGAAKAVCDAVLLVRNLVSQPGNVATPGYLAEKALELSARYGIDCQVLEREDMERHGMEALLAVAKGSRQAPKFIVLEYRGGVEGKRPVVLVGKGITFDSGGISLKPRDGMERMKDDMAGAAAVMGTIVAAASLRMPVNVVALIPAAENLPDGGAYKPGDIVTSMAGKTIEIVNTDAEGRMILCDALHYAHRYRPSAIIDVATLTGACLVALGTFATGLMGNDGGLKRDLVRAGEATGERLWELPLWEEYGELMKSDIADLKNAGGPHAGTISAGWFLKQFAGKAKWAHLDIAGTAWEEKGRPYLPKGATGVGVRLLVEYLRGISKR